MKIPFEAEYRNKYYELLNKVFDSNMWTDGILTKEFEKNFSNYIGIESKTIANGGVGLLSILEYIDVKDKEVIIPSNTFWATAQAVKKAGGKIIYADCNKEDLCLSYNDMITKITPNTKAVIVVHIGGHIAFEIEKIATFCKEKNIYLIEDCAHVHGASFNNKMGGSWGFAGSYSFYATKTMPMGEGGMIVSHNNEFINWISKYRNYGKEIIDKKVTYPINNGFNYRMSEFSAALGIIQLERLPIILEWKWNLAKKFDQIFENRIKFPIGMISGYYKYIVFDYKLKEKTGKVYENTDLCHIIDKCSTNLKNTEWIAAHHDCVPIYYGWDKFDLDINSLRNELIC